jgi:hypothetical protein
MTFNFAPDTKHATGGNLMPRGLLHHAVVAIRSLKNSKASNGEYADIELTMVDGPFEGRKVWPMIANPSDERNSEKWREMSIANIQHALEAARVFDPSKPETYNQFADKTFSDILLALDGKTVAVKIGIEKGTDGHQDKNNVAEWLSPNPVSGTNKLYVKLAAGDHGVDTTANTGAAGSAPGGAGFTLGAGAAPATNAGNNASAATPAAAATGAKPAWL